MVGLSQKYKGSMKVSAKKRPRQREPEPPDSGGQPGEVRSAILGYVRARRSSVQCPKLKGEYSRDCPCHVDRTAAETGRVRVCLTKRPAMRGSASVAFGMQGWLSRAPADAAANNVVTTVNANNATRIEFHPSFGTGNRSHRAPLGEALLLSDGGAPCPRATSLALALALAPGVYSDPRRRRSDYRRVDGRRHGLDRRLQWRSRLLDRNQKFTAGSRDLPSGRLPQNERLAEHVEIWRPCSDALHAVCPVSATGHQEGDVVPKVRERKAPAGRPRQHLENGDLKTHATPPRHDGSLRPVTQRSLCQVQSVPRWQASRQSKIGSRINPHPRHKA